MINFIMQTAAGISILVILSVAAYGLYFIFLTGGLLTVIAFSMLIGIAYAIGKTIDTSI